MVSFCIDRIILGTDDHLVVVDGLFAWSKFVPKDTWHLDGTTKDHSDWCLDTLLRLSDITIRVAPPDRFVKSMTLLSGSLESQYVPWAKIMPTKEHQCFTKRLINDIELAIANASIDYYKTIWVPGSALLASLKPAFVDRCAQQDLERAGEGNLSAIRSFAPCDEGCSKLIKYDRFKTLTGRLTVSQGPQILTLKREHRGIIRSSYGDNGSIVALDFAALEARILLYEYGRKCEDVDLYGTIAKELGHDRKAIKGAVISELYGSSKYALGKHLGIEGNELNEFVKKIKTYFSTHQLLARVKKQFISTGKVINRYGRKVTIDEPLDNIFISYYGQSTGVDVTMLGFHQIVELLAKKAPRTRPIFLLHDSIFLDVHNEELGIVEQIKHVKVKGYVQKFPLRLEKIS